MEHCCNVPTLLIQYAGKHVLCLRRVRTIILNQSFQKRHKSYNLNFTETIKNLIMHEIRLFCFYTYILILYKISDIHNP